MSLIKIENITPDVRLGLWKIDESVDEMLRSDAALQRVYPSMSAYRSEARKRERLAVYALLYAMTGDEAMVIRHNEDGKPMVDGFHISVSHTRGYAALILSEHAEVAVDIEWRSDRVEKVVHKFVREDEDKSSLDMLLVNWSAKETVYKFFSEQDLQYFDMRLQPFDISTAGQIVVENLKGRQAADVHYRLTEDYVLTYTY